LVHAAAGMAAVIRTAARIRMLFFMV